MLALSGVQVRTLCHRPRYSLQAASRCQPAACVQRLELMQAYRKAAVKVIGGPSDLEETAALCQCLLQ